MIPSNRVGSRNYSDALRAIHARSGYDRGFISDPFAGDAAARRGLRRTAALLDRLGRPQDRYGIVHVAGSKGKGSTCALLDSALRAAGHRVGLHTSPHLHRFPERIVVGGEPVDDPIFAALTARVVAAAEELERQQPDLGGVTAFELTTAMALDHFAAVGCDLAVVEVGLGGALDATNVVDPLVAVITALDLEHTAILGSTLAAIAAQKAGIVKPGRPVVVGPQPAAALAVVLDAARRAGSRALVAGRDWQVAGNWRDFAASGPWGSYAGLRSGLVGPHQVDNAGAAIAAAWLLGESGHAVPEAAVRAGLRAARWPGRFERVPRAALARWLAAGVPGGDQAEPAEGTSRRASRDRLPGGADADPGGPAILSSNPLTDADPMPPPDVILDGAHTAASAAVLAATVAAEFPERPAVLVLGTLTDKEPAALAAALRVVARDVVATTARIPRAMPAEVVAEGARAAGLSVETVGGVSAAVVRATALAGPGGLVVVTGSLSVVAEAREALGLAKSDEV